MLSPRPWNLDAVARLVLGVFMCLFVGLLLALLVRGAGDDKSPVTVWQIVVTGFCFQGASIVLVWRFAREHGLGMVEAFGFRNAGLRAATLGTLVVVGFLPLGSLLQGVSITALKSLGIEPVAQSAVEALRHAAQGPGLLLFALITIVIAPLGEELLFRGVLYPAVKRAGFPRLALWGTSILFAVIHFNLPALLPLLVLALVLVWLYERTDNLLAPIAAHVVFNSANLVIFFLNDPARYPSRP